MTERTATHYNWDQMKPDFPRSLVERKRIVGDQAMVCRFLLKKGCYVPSHAHENEQIACVMSGELRFEVGKPESDSFREMTVRSGEVLHLPSNLPHAAEAMVDSVVIDVFSPPSESTGVDEQ